MTTWKSAIMDDHGWDGVEEDPEAFERYERWLEQVMDEPWFTGLEDLVKWSGVWIGTEEQIIEELKLLAGREVSSSPEFPSSFEQLERYVSIALDGFFQKNLILLHYRDLTEEDLDDFDVPGWGPEAPVLVHQGKAAARPDYWEAMVKLLAYGNALPLAVLIFTGNDRHFRNYRKWTGTTKELMGKLDEYYPDIGLVPMFFANCFRPPEEHTKHLYFSCDTYALLYPMSREDYMRFHKRLRSWAPFLQQEARIKVTWEKRKATVSRRFAEGETEVVERTYWTIESPRWKKREDLFANPGVSAKELGMMVAMWLAPSE
jgi:hypothetical protein